MTQIYSTKDNQLIFNLSPDAYSKDDIFLAQSMMSNECVLYMDVTETIDVTITPTLEASLEDLAKKFLFYLSEQKIRNILNKENGKIRDLIVEQAFKPIENLKGRVNEC